MAQSSLFAMGSLDYLQRYMDNVLLGTKLPHLSCSRAMALAPALISH